MLRYIISFYMASCLATLKAANDPDPLPDSLLTEDRVYELTFSDPELAGRIISEMRRRQVEPKYGLNILEGDLLIDNRYFDIRLGGCRFRQKLIRTQVLKMLDICFSTRGAAYSRCCRPLVLPLREVLP